MQCIKCKAKWSYSLCDKNNKKGCFTKAQESDNTHQPLCNDCNLQNLQRSERKKDNSPSSKEATLSEAQKANTSSSEINSKPKKKKSKKNKNKNADLKEASEKLPSPGTKCNSKVSDSIQLIESNENNNPIKFNEVPRKKYINTTRKENITVLKFSSSKIEQGILKQFAKSFGLDGLGYENCFETFAEATDHFSTKYAYLIKPKSPHKGVDLFHQHLPLNVMEAYKVTQDDIPDVPSSLCIGEDSIKTLSDSQWLNDEVVEVILCILALYVEKEFSPPGEQSAGIVGSVLSNQYIIPRENNFQLLHDYIKKSNR